MCCLTEGRETAEVPPGLDWTHTHSYTHFYVHYGSSHITTFTSPSSTLCVCILLIALYLIHRI